MRVNWLRVCFAVSPVLVVVVGYLTWVNVWGLKPEKPRKWRDKYSNQPVDHSLLEENGVLITNNIYSQIFTPYAMNWNELLFITSDSLLNAYHVLYEETVFQMECQHAGQLPEVLRNILENLDHAESQFKGDQATIDKSKERALLVVGIALKLMDDSFEVNGFWLNRTLNSEVRKIRAGNARELPEWLGEADTSLIELDYSRYQPRGFYTREEYLKRYFQAVSWLQSIPFRVDRDEELTAILMLGASISSSDDDLQSYFRSYENYIGSCDDLDLLMASELDFELIDVSKEGLDDMRKQVLLIEQEGTGKSLINDQRRLLPFNQNDYEETDFRIISGYRTPSAILFQKTTDRRKFKRPYPNGLEVPAALGSSIALASMEDSDGSELIETIQSCEEYFKGESIDDVYLGALADLVNEPDEGAPEFMRKDGWKWKSCQTVLASWAQKRHTFVLQVKESVHYDESSAALEKLAGFVEPDPEFFAKMAKLVQRTKSQLEEDGWFDHEGMILSDEPKVEMERRWESLELLSQKLEEISRKQIHGEDLSWEDKSTIEYYGERLAWIMLYEGDTYEDPVDEAPNITDVFANPEDKGYLHVGVSRARGIYVLYPWKGETYLCYGAIMPYHEFVSPTRLTDEEWMEMLDSGKDVGVPQWIEPIMAGGD